jgi:Zn-finger nucleic acid-binding protein
MLLVQCESCRRQHDASALAPGRRLRCACGAELAVPARAPLAVQALACAGCGGPVELGRASCAYCGAALDRLERDAGTLCPACGTRMSDGARYCPGCALAIRPQALTALPSGTCCPRCGGALASRALSDASAVECGKCLGLWLSARDFEHLCASAEAAGAKAPTPVGDGGPRLADPVRHIPCVACGELMQRRMFAWNGRPSGALVDVCREHGVWLDAGELQRVLACARRRPAPDDRTPRLAPEIDRALSHALALDEPALGRWLRRLGFGGRAAAG